MWNLNDISSASRKCHGDLFRFYSDSQVMDRQQWQRLNVPWEVLDQVFIWIICLLTIARHCYSFSMIWVYLCFVCRSMILFRYLSQDDSIRLTACVASISLNRWKAHSDFNPGFNAIPFAAATLEKSPEYHRRFGGQGRGTCLRGFVVNNFWAKRRLSTVFNRPQRTKAGSTTQNASTRIEWFKFREYCPGDLTSSSYKSIFI